MANNDEGIYEAHPSDAQLEFSTEKIESLENLSMRLNIIRKNFVLKYTKNTYTTKAIVSSFSRISIRRRVL